MNNTRFSSGIACKLMSSTSEQARLVDEGTHTSCGFGKCTKLEPGKLVVVMRRTAMIAITNITKPDVGDDERKQTLQRKVVCSRYLYLYRYVHAF